MTVMEDRKLQKYGTLIALAGVISLVFTLVYSGSPILGY